MTYNCSCLAGDLGKIFDVYWLLAQKDSKIPDPWPKKYKTSINAGVQTGIKHMNLNKFLSIYSIIKNDVDSLDGWQTSLSRLLLQS